MEIQEAQAEAEAIKMASAVQELLNKDMAEAEEMAIQELTQDLGAAVLVPLAVKHLVTHQDLVALV
jgi:hypothetical protein